MAPLPGQPGYLGNYFQAGKTEETSVPPEPSTDRSWGRAAIDTGLQIGRVPWEMARGVTSVGRRIADDPYGLLAQADKFTGRVLQGFEEELSPRAKELQGAKLFPGVDDTSATTARNLPGYVGQQLAGLAPWLIGGVLGGGSKLAGAIGAGTMGLAGHGQMDSAVRDYTDNTPVEVLQKEVPEWNDLLRGAGGDELKARDALYKKGVDLLSQAANAALNVAGGYALTGRLTAGGRLVPRTAIGTAEGMAMGGGAGMAQEAGQQQFDVNVGRTPRFDIERMLRAGLEAGVPMGAIMGGQRAIHGGRAIRTDRGIDPEQQVALGQELGPPAPDPFTRTPEPPEGPPGMPDTRPPPGAPFRPEIEPPAGPAGAPDIRRPPGAPFVPEAPMEPEAPFRPAPRVEPGTERFRGEPRDRDLEMQEYERYLTAEQGELPLPTQGELFPRPVRPRPDEAPPPRPDTLRQGQLPLYDIGGPLGDYQRTLDLATPTRPERPPTRRRRNIDQEVTNEELIDFVAPEVGRPQPPAPPTGGGGPPSGGAPGGGVSPRLQRIRALTRAARGVVEGMEARGARFEAESQQAIDALREGRPVKAAKAAKAKATSRRRAAPAEAPAPAEVTPEVTRPQGTLSLGARPTGMARLAAAEQRVGRTPTERIRVGGREIEVQRKRPMAKKEIEVKARNPETFNAWTGENLRSEEETRAFILAGRKGGYLKSTDAMPVEAPPHFMAEQAQRARWRVGLPIEWDAFRKVFTEAHEAGEQALSRARQTMASKAAGERIELTSKGRAPSEQGKSNIDRRTRQKGEREEIARKAIEETWASREKGVREKLLSAATRDVGFEQAHVEAAAKGKKAKRRKLADYGVTPEAEHRLDPRRLARTARSLLEVAKDQLKRFEDAIETWKKENRERGEAMPGKKHDVMRMPTGRSGGKEAPFFSRISRTAKFVRDAEGLLTQIEKGKDVSGQLRTVLDRWAKDEYGGAEMAHETRRTESAELTERRAGEGNVGAEKVRLEDVSTEEADDPRYHMIGGRTTSGDILWERFQREWAEDHPGKPLPSRGEISEELGGRARLPAPVDPLEAMPKHLREIMDQRERLTKKVTDEGRVSRVPRSTSEALVRHGALDDVEANRLRSEDATATAYIIAARRTMNARLADIFDKLAEGIPDQRTKYETMARAARDMDHIPAEHVAELERIIREDSETSAHPAVRFAGEEALDAIPQWFIDRYKADRILQGIEKLAPGGRTTEYPIEAERPRMTKKETEAIWKRRAPEPEPEPVTREVTPAPEADPAVVRKLTRRGDVDDVKGVAKMSDVAERMVVKGDALDAHLKDVVEQTIGDVRIASLDDATYDAVMEKLAPQHKDSDGYYHEPTDRIFIRRKAIGDKTLLKHEATHALTLAAIEKNAPARAGLEKLMKMARDRSEYWRKGLDDDQIRAVDKILNDVHEFVSEVWSNDAFRRVLAAVPLRPGEAAALQAPKARSWMEAFRTWVQKAVTSLFRSVSPNNALNEALVRTMDLFNEVAEAGGRPVLGKGKTIPTGKPGRALDWLKEGRLAETGRDATYRFKRGGWTGRGLWAHTLEDLTRRGEAAFQGATRPVLDAVARLNTARHKIAVERGDPEMLKELAEFMQRPQADKAADFLIRETMHGAYADEDVGTGKNKFVKQKGLRYTQTRQNHDAMRAEYERLARDVQGFREIRQRLHDWGHKVAQEDLTAAIRDAVSLDKVTHDAAGNMDPVAASAFAKYVTRDSNLTGNEQAWIDRQRPAGKDMNDYLARMKFDKLVEDYRKLPEFRRRNGPYVPLKRHGGFAIFGEYQLPTVDPTQGRELGNGFYEFYSPAAAEAFIKSVPTKMLSYDRVAYVRDSGAPETWKEATEISERSRWEGGPVGEPGYVVTTAEGERRVPASRADKDPALQVRPRIHFNTKHFELHDNERQAHEQRDRLAARGIRMREEVQLVRDLADYQSPHFMSDAMENLVNRARNSAEYKRMSAGERQAWERRLSTEAAKLVMAAGGRAPGLPREFVEGASRNLVENYAEASVQSAANAAHSRHAQEIRDAFKGLDKYVGDREFGEGNALRQEVADELRRRAFSVQDPIAHGIWGKATNRLLQMTYTAKLAGTSFLAINLTEPVIIGLPYLASRYGAWQAFKTMRQSYKDLAGLKILGAGFDDFKKAFARKDGKWTDYDETLEKNLRASGAADADALVEMLKTVSDKGLFDRSAVNEISMLREVPKTGVLGKGLDWIDDTFRGMNQSVETLNRAVLAVTAYRAAKGDHAARVRAAEDAIYRGAGQYAAWNAPPAFNHPVGRIALQFKKYGQRIMSNYIEAVAGTIKGDKEKTKQLVYMLAMQATVAGAFGLPTEVFSVPVNAAFLTGLTDFGWQDVQHEIVKLMSDEFGADAAQIIAHGMPRMAGVDLSTRFGHDSMLFFGTPKGREPQDLKASIATIALGAPGSQLEAIVKGVTALSKAAQDYGAGAYTRGNEQAMQGVRELIPIRQVGDLYDAYRKSMGDGTTRTRGGALLGPEYTGWEALTRGLGFTPAGEATRQEQRRVEQTAQRRMLADRKTWLDRYASAPPAERPGIKAALRDWNYGKPRDQQITEPDLVRAISRRRQQEARPAGEMGLGENRRFRELHREMQQIYGGT